MLFLLTSIVENKAQCTYEVTLENPSYATIANESVVEYDVVLNLLTNTSSLPSGIPLNGLNILISSNQGVLNSLVNASNSILNVIQPNNGIATAFGNNGTLGNPQVTAACGISPSPNFNTFFLPSTVVPPTAPSTTFRYKATLFTWRLRASNGPNSCVTLAMINSTTNNNVQSSGIICGSANSSTIVTANFPNGGTICTPPLPIPTWTIAGVIERAGKNKTKPNGDLFYAPCVYPDPLGGTNPISSFGIDGVKVAINTVQSKTNFLGEYNQSNKTQLVNYTITPTKDDDNLKCGASTLELVLMSRHILGTVPFTDWYNYVAADINRNGTITTADIVELRKMLLGIQTGFTNNTSWRFFSKDNIPTISSPPVQIVGGQSIRQITPLVGDRLSEDFWGVKIGDIDGNCKGCGANGNRPEEEVTPFHQEQFVRVDDFSATQGESFDIPVRVGEDNVAILYSLGFQLDVTNLEILDIIPNEAIGMRTENFAWNNDENWIKMIWSIDSGNPMLFREGDILFHIRVYAKNNFGSLDNLISLKPEILESNVYGMEESTNSQLILKIENSATNRSMNDGKAKQIAQISEGGTRVNLNFYATKSGTSSLVIYDVQGREIYRKKNIATVKGNNNIDVDFDNNEKSQMYFYYLETPTYPTSGKFVKFTY